MSGKLPAAASITLLLPQLSISYQWTPVLISNWTMARCPLKQAQCKGFGLISLVAPITTFLNSGLTSRYCWAAPLEIINLTILVCPRQQAQMKAVHLFLLFSKPNQQCTFIIKICLPFDASLHLFILTLLHTGNQSFIEGSLVLASHFLLFLLLFSLNDLHLLLFWRLHLQYDYILDFPLSSNRQ